MKSGNLEGLKLLQEVAKEHPNTKAGQAAAMVISQFEGYRSKGQDNAARSDVKNIVTNLETFFADNKRFPRGIDEIKSMYKAPPAPQGELSKYQDPPKAHKITSENVNVVILLSNDGKSYRICSYHTEGKKAFCMESENTQLAEIDRSKGVIEDMTAVGTSLGTIEGLSILVKK